MWPVAKLSIDRLVDLTGASVLSRQLNRDGGGQSGVRTEPARPSVCCCETLPRRRRLLVSRDDPTEHLDGNPN
jgi:hypothetical protein